MEALCLGAVLVALFHHKEGADFYRFARNRREALILLGAAMLGFVVYEMAYNVALSSMPAQHTTILYYTYPIFSSLFALGLLLTMALFYNILNQILYIRANSGATSRI